MLYLQSAILFTDIHVFIVFSLLSKGQPTSSFCSPTIIFFTFTNSLEKQRCVCSDVEFLEGSSDGAIIPAFTPREGILVRET